MRVAFDSVVLGAYLHPDAAYPTPVERVPERLNHFVDTLEAARATIIIPTPALSEFLVLAASDAAAYVAELANSAFLWSSPSTSEPPSKLRNRSGGQSMPGARSRVRLVPGRR